MKNLAITAAVAVGLALSAPASAVTFTFGTGVVGDSGTKYNNGNAALLYTAGTYSATVGGFSWPDLLPGNVTMGPNDFITYVTAAERTRAQVFSFLSATPVSKDRYGLGVCSLGDDLNNDKCPQIETNDRNEILSVKLAPGSFKLAKAVFSKVDSDDTLGLFGVTAAGVVERIGYDGQFDAPGNGHGFLPGAGVGGGVGGGPNNTFYTLTFDTGAYQEFLFANNNITNDGYRLNAITAAVPEPATWGLMLLGFGLVGASMRRRGVAVAA